MTAVESHIEGFLTPLFKEEEWQHCFLVDIELKGRRINVFLDADEGITFSICRRISRMLEESLDERKDVPEDYTLEVSSPGLGRPLKLTRQYIKNIGRSLNIKLSSGNKIEGKLISVDDDGIELETDHPDKSKKTKVIKKIGFLEINKTKINVSFK